MGMDSCVVEFSFARFFISETKSDPELCGGTVDCLMLKKGDANGGGNDGVGGEDDVIGLVDMSG